MAINPLALKAYGSVAELSKTALGESAAKKGAGSDFTKALSDSLAKVNDLQSEKAQMIQAFATGEKQNVHELMITLQKAGLAMSLTSAVRNKVLEAYKELTRMPF